jgi:hypothetical protein
MIGFGMEVIRNAYKDIIRKLKGTRYVCRWEDNFQMDFEGTVWEDLD